MESLPRLVTERLVLTVPGPADLERLLSFTVRNEAHFARYTPAPEREALEGVLRRRVADAEALYHADRGLLLILSSRAEPRGPVLGDVHFSNVVRGAFHACHVGYKIDRDAEGKNLMAEALVAAIGHVFDGMKLHRVMANYQPDNERSARLLARLGFVVEGYARDYLHIAGAWRDHVLTALTNPRWTPSAS
ncbi:MAG: GNAT family N-acetyltransferase [Deltaproteobacteria bacterium]|nr:GNAT family N-acetyltransferase [Deltaproteobacteria bacterium]